MRNEGCKVVCWQASTTARHFSSPSSLADIGYKLTQARHKPRLEEKTTSGRTRQLPTGPESWRARETRAGGRRQLRGIPDIPLICCTYSSHCRHVSMSMWGTSIQYRCYIGNREAWCPETSRKIDLDIHQRRSTVLISLCFFIYSIAQTSCACSFYVYGGEG